MKLFFVATGVALFATGMVIASNIASLGVEETKSRTLLYIGYFLCISSLIFFGSILYDRFGKK
jgi:hypothetical protein